ncbi:serine/threonine-protein phosphatase 6 regulatory ankyrin repeat subunit B-like [Nasonia vitripennis]|uniref:Uncharacterized protein n=1 Tax=Nasonia vitripennis TaxID=7425 RepID=A0A7M7QP80_NASVI|nr:serine/threonine-protein phosphatase 6 regulatory ankyrin repeat subunit B-like [Nasonia vitripennis]
MLRSLIFGQSRIFYMLDVNENVTEVVHREWLEPESSAKDFDEIFRKSLDELFCDRRGSCSGQIKDPIIKHQLLEQETSLSSVFSREELGNLSLLWVAVFGAYHKSAELLVRSGADVNEPFGIHEPQVIDEKWTILHELLEMKPTPEGEQLIRLMVTNHGADLQARDSKGETALHIAVSKGLVPIVEMMLEKGADVQARDLGGQTPLHFAALRGQVQIVEMLLEKGAGVNVPDESGQTPLHVAAMGSKADELLPLFIKHGANVTDKTHSGFNVLHFLTRASDLERPADLVEVIIEKGGVSLVNERAAINQLQPIHSAAVAGNIELVNIYLNLGAKVNSLAYEDVSPLYLAAQQQAPATVIKTLLNRGANVALTTRDGRTALHAACENFDLANCEESIKLLLSSCADPTIEDRFGLTPLALIEEPDTNSGACLVIKHLALKKACKPSIELKDERLIERHSNLLDYFRKCMEQIERMQSSRIERCSIFDILMECECTIAVFMRNPRFEIGFNNYDLSEFSEYAEDLVEAFERVEKHYEFVMREEDSLFEAFLDTLPYLVVRKLLHYVCDCCSIVKRVIGPYSVC